MTTSPTTRVEALALPEGCWWHVVWATFLAWPPTDERGDWRGLAAMYSQVAAAGGSVRFRESLPDRWQGCPAPIGHVALTTAVGERLVGTLHELAKSDRIAGGTAISAIAFAQHWVQLVLFCPAATLNQRVGRLKSRSATLLAYEPSLGVGGTGTWGRGFWWANLLDDVAVGLASSFVSDGGRTEPIAMTGGGS